MFRIRLMMLAGLMAFAFASAAIPGEALAGGKCCQPTKMTTLCVVDPCNGCTSSVRVCVPCCCTEDAVMTCWRKGAFGRKILTYKWPCCGHCVEVVLTKRGRIKVR